MKNTILLVFLITLFYSCNEDKKLLKDSETFLKTQLDDPDSYKNDSLIITEKITYLQDKKYSNHMGLYVNKRVIEDLKESITEDSISLVKNFSSYMNYIKRNDNNEIKKMYEDELWTLNTKNEYRNKQIDSLSNLVSHLVEDSIKIFPQKDDQRTQRIIIKNVFRAKNKFGGYVKQTGWIIWYPEKGFELSTIE